MYRNRFSSGRYITVLLLLAWSISGTVGFVLMPPATIASGIDLDSFYDHFDDGSFNNSLWTIGSFEGSDSLVTVSETGGQLVITPRSGQTGLHYNGLISSRTYNFTRGIIFVEVAEVTQGGANTKITFGADNTNKIKMEAESGRLHMSLVVGNSDTGVASIPYDSGAHRWWRIRHVASGDTIRFDTSPDGITWTQRHSIARGSLNITAGKVNLSAGTWNSQSSPGRARFDNLSWHPLIPNKGDWSAPATALTPNATPGTWDHILWGAASPSTVVKFNGTYFLYYVGAAGDTGDPEYNPIRRSLGVATSSNGVQFTKYGSNPIITYTTTGGSVPEEGVGGATAIVVGNTIHLYYAAIRSTGGQTVDLDIRYRKSTDGYNFTNDTLIYRSSGDEYAPLSVTYNGSTWSVYIKGPLTNGKGQISRLFGTSPTSLPNKANVTSTTFGSGGNANYIRSNVFVVHLDRRETTEDRFQVRSINTGSPNVLSEPIFSYTFGNFGDHATPATFRDEVTGKWFMYTLNLSMEPAVISVRTYTPSQTVAPTSTPITATTLTRTPTLLTTFTQTPKGIATSTPISMATPTRTPTLLATFTRTPTGIATSTPTRTLTPPATQAGIHVGDLDGNSQENGRNWMVTVYILIHNSNHQPVANARIRATWSNGYSGTGECVSDSTGYCAIQGGRAAKNSNTIIFTINSISHPSLPYLPAWNHDPDGDSNGSVITIRRL